MYFSVLNCQPELVLLGDIDPSITQDARYATIENFVGRPINGYSDPKVLLTLQTAQSLKKAQEIFKQIGYSIVIYDGYRPVQAVSDFIQWGQNNDQEKKEFYYPTLEKDMLFEYGYIAKESSHSHGTTVDITLIKEGEQMHPIIPRKVKLSNNEEVLRLDDGSLDMGTSFDLFHPASHSGTDLVSEEAQRNRELLKSVMIQCGFLTIKTE